MWNKVIFSLCRRLSLSTAAFFLPNPQTEATALEFPAGISSDFHEKRSGVSFFIFNDDGAADAAAKWSWACGGESRGSFGLVSKVASIFAAMSVFAGPAQSRPWRSSPSTWLPLSPNRWRAREPLSFSKRFEGSRRRLHGFSAMTNCATTHHSPCFNFAGT